MSPRRRALPAVTALLATLLAAGWDHALAGWREDYKEGLQAVEDEKYNKAENLLRAALEKKSEEKANAIKASGMFFEPYLPHFYLGLALFHKKEYEEAVRELEISESMGVVTKDQALMAQLTQTKSVAAQLAEAARRQPSPPPPPQPPPAARPDSSAEGGAGKGGDAPAEPAPAAPKGSKSPGETPPVKTITQAEPLEPPASGPDPALVRARDAAAGDIARALKLKTDAGGDLSSQERESLDAAVSAIREAGSPAQATSAHESLKKMTSEYSRAVDQRRSRRAAQELDRARREAGATLSAGKKLLSGSGSEMKSSERSRLSGEIAAVEKASSADAVRRAARELERDVESLRKEISKRAAAPPPVDDGRARAESLARARKAYAGAVEAYYSGDYERAVAGLEAAGDEIEDDPEIHALLGSALYRQFILTRSRDESLKARAETAFRNALRIRPGFTLDTGDYPPKVVSFFRQVAAGSSGQ